MLLNRNIFSFNNISCLSGRVRLFPELIKCFLCTSAELCEVFRVVVYIFVLSSTAGSWLIGILLAS